MNLLPAGPITRGVLLKLIKQLNDALGLTSIIVSHDVYETGKIADYIYLIAKGSVIGEGVPEELLNNQSPQVKQFIHGLPDGPVHFHYPSIDFKEEILL